MDDHHTHATASPGSPRSADPCDGPDQVRLAARNAFRRGATQIKVCVSGGVVSFTDRIEDAQFTVEELKAAVAEADARGTYVTAHAHNVKGIRNGLAAGVECFEHGTFLDDDTATAMAEAGAYLVPTFAVVRLFAEKAKDWGIPDEIVPRIDGIEDAMARSLKLARDAGRGHRLRLRHPRARAGPPGPRADDQLRARSRRWRRSSPARRPTPASSGRPTTSARSKPGKRADLIAIDGDPLTDPKVFDDPARVVLVVKDGQVVKDTR